MQVIFQSRNGSKSKNDGWLDYCRETAPADEKPDEWATKMVAQLSRQIGCECRFRLENW